MEFEVEKPHEIFSPIFQQRVVARAPYAELSLVYDRRRITADPYLALGLMSITNPSKMNPVVYHTHLMELGRILGGKSGLDYHPRYVEIGIDTYDPIEGNAFKRFAVPKWTNLETAPFFFTEDPSDPSRVARVDGFAPAGGAQYIKGRASHCHFHAYEREDTLLHYEARDKRPFLRRSGINTIESLFERSVEIVKKQIGLWALWDDAFHRFREWKKEGRCNLDNARAKEILRTLEEKTTIEALTQISKMFPLMRLTWIKRKFFEKLPFPKLSNPRLHNNNIDKMTRSSVEVLPITSKNNDLLPTQLALFSMEEEKLKTAPKRRHRRRTKSSTSDTIWMQQCLFEKKNGSCLLGEVGSFWTQRRGTWLSCSCNTRKRNELLLVTRELKEKQLPDSLDASRGQKSRPSFLVEGWEVPDWWDERGREIDRWLEDCLPPSTTSLCPSKQNIRKPQVGTSPCGGYLEGECRDESDGPKDTILNGWTSKQTKTTSQNTVL